MSSTPPSAPPSPLAPRRAPAWRWWLIAMAVLASAGGLFLVFRQSTGTDESRAFRARVKELEQRVAAHPQDPKPRLQLAQELGKSLPEEALAHLRKIPPGAAEYLPAVKASAAHLLELGRLKDAAGLLDLLRKSAPDDGDVAALAAQFQMRRHNPRQALVDARRAAELQPERIDRWLLVAEICDQSNKAYAMIAPLETALKLDPEHYGARVQLAYALHASGRLEESRQHAEWCASQNRSDVVPERLLAAIARDGAELELAERHIRRALEIAPRDVESRIIEADLLMFRRQPEAAYQRLVEIHGDVAPSFRYLGALSRAAAASGRNREAEQIVQELERRQNAGPTRASN